MPMPRSSCAFWLLLLIASTACAQVETGTPPFGSFSGGPDVVNLGNLNVHLSVPVINKSGRGTDFTYDLSYDTSVWYPVGSSGSQTWQPVPNWGWRGETEVEVGYVSYSVTQTPTCYFGGIYQGINYNYHNWYYHDSFGVAHWFPGLGTTVIQPTGQYCSSSSSSSTGTAGDGSGWTLSATGSGVNSVTSVDGAVLHPPLNTTTGAGTFTDRNGNKLTVDTSGHFFDTLSSTASVLTVSGLGTPASPRTFSYLAPPGGNAAYTVKYSTYTVQTKFNCSGVSEYGANGTTTASLVSEIDLPDNSKYTFLYEPTPGVAGHVTGRLASVTLPMGGATTYSYSGGGVGVNGITCADGSGATIQRHTPDGIWNYEKTLVAGTQWKTIITDPSTPANQTVIQFQSVQIQGTQAIYETQRKIYQGSSTSGTLLATTSTCYNGNPSPCTGSVLTLPFSQISVISILPGASNFQSKKVASLDGYGLVTELHEYDFGSGSPPTTPVRKTFTPYATLGNGIVDMPASVTVKDGSNNVKAQTTFTYDQGTPVATSNTPQHAAISGSRGNVTTIARLTQGSSTLNQTVTYYDTGMVQTLTDANGALTTYNYSNATSTCGNAFPTSVSEPMGLSKSMTWNCTGGVGLSATDENAKTATATYNDLYFWRPNTVSDQTLNAATIAYATGGLAVTPYFYLNNNNSIVAVAHNFDGLGRSSFDQWYQSPSGQNFDTVSYTYDSSGRPYSTSVPCSVGAGSNCPPATPKTTQTYDALNRPLLATDGGGGTTSYSYTQNDVLVTVGQVGPPPTGENNKRRQLEYDGLGRLTSVCEITGGSGSGSCGQNSPQTGFWTKYTYDTLGNLTGVTQNAQGTAQTRSYNYDALSRLTSETNPESGTRTYSYDTSTGCAPSAPGELIKVTDASGNWTCYAHDVLHRLTDVGNGNQSATNPCKRFKYDNSTGVLGSRPSGVSVSNGLGRLVEAETDTCAWPVTQSSILTDEWFSYTARGEVSDLYESTPHSGGYYHTAATYWANGVVNQLTGGAGYSVTYNLDGEGRVYSTAPSVGALNSTLYNAASQPTQVTFASLDSDTFTYDPNTNRMTQYKFNVNGQSVIGNLTWNPVGTLASLGITDPFNSANTQTCNYSHDDLTRIASANCGSAANQTFSYDAFGNINKSGSPNSFQPNYSSATNRMTLIGGSAPSYDANGNVLNDFLHSYTWNVYGRPISIDTVGITYDALDRMVEQNRSGSYTEIAYAPTGEKIELLNGQTYTKAFVPLPGGAVAVYGGALVNFRHADHLGSSRFTSASNRTMYSDGAYAPFGEPYAQTGTTDLSFTGKNQDTVSNLYDFSAREYGIQGRWPSPDPAGLAAAYPGNPQSWNRYAYVVNDPLNLIDPSGLDSIDPFKNNRPRRIHPRPRHAIGCGYSQTSMFGGGGCLDNWDPFWILNLMSPNGWTDEGTPIFPYVGLFYSQLFLPGPEGGSSSSGFKKVLRKIGDYIPTSCGGGTFSYSGARSSVGPGSFGLYSMNATDTRSGNSSGVLADYTVGEVLQGGYGHALYSDGSHENFLFAGVGLDGIYGSGNVSQYISHVSGDSLLRNQVGFNIDVGDGAWGGGYAAGFNTDSLTSCVDHNYK
jgi:RHS repeat-associated protein